MQVNSYSDGVGTDLFKTELEDEVSSVVRKAKTKKAKK